MRRLLVIAFVLSLTPALQAQTIHQHPQKATYASPAEWPPALSSQCHWPRVPGADPSLPMTHLHVDPLVPLDGEINGPMTFPITVGLFNTTGSVIDAQAVAGWHDGALVGSIDLPPLTGKLGEFVTVSGTFTVTPPIPHGWYWIQVNVRARMDDGSVVTTRAARPVYSTLDVTAPEITYGGWSPTECNFSSAADPTNDPSRIYGQQVVEFDFLASEPSAPFIPFPITPISHVWPMYASSFGYASAFTDTVPALTRFVLDPDYHHGNPGTTLESVTQAGDLLHLPVLFNQTGTHKYAVIRDLTVPEIGEHIMALLVGTVTGTADLSPEPQPFPLPIVITPPMPPACLPPNMLMGTQCVAPPPPAPTFVGVSQVCAVERFSDGSTKNKCLDVP